MGSVVLHEWTLAERLELALSNIGHLGWSKHLSTILAWVASANRLEYSLEQHYFEDRLQVQLAIHLINIFVRMPNRQHDHFNLPYEILENHPSQGPKHEP